MIAALTYVALVALGVSAAGSFVRRTPTAGTAGAWRPAAALWLVVAVPSLVQVAVPGLLRMARRDPDRIGEGQVWRLVTSAVTQDGGTFGTVFNLIVLAVTVAAAVRVLGGRRLWLTFWVGAVAGNLLVLAFLPSVGAGNSIATFTVAAATVTVVCRDRPDAAAIARQVAVLGLGAALLLGDDQHGFSVVVGTLAGLVPRRAPDPA